METGAYWLLYVVSFSGALLHWRLGHELLAALCGITALLSALLIGGIRITPVPR
ncbi:hypothetical protein ACFW4K_01260 [Nocardiopsis alba]|uniref:hypothetical protein n=1 Tax=Nocardiopsis alba TaxID=53437 RepID=UPI003672EB51